VDALDLMLARRSIRRFTTQDVALEDEQNLIDAAFAAPSGNNARPWHFVFVRDPATRARLKDMHEWTWMLDKAPLVVAVLGNDEDSPWWIEDCAAAAENILLEATALGLGSVWCGMREDATEWSAAREPAARCWASLWASGACWRSSASATPARRRSRARSAR